MLIKIVILLVVCFGLYTEACSECGGCGCQNYNVGSYETSPLVNTVPTIQLIDYPQNIQQALRIQVPAQSIQPVQTVESLQPIRIIPSLQTIQSLQPFQTVQSIQPVQTFSPGRALQLISSLQNGQTVRFV